LNYEDLSITRGIILQAPIAEKDKRGFLHLSLGNDFCTCFLHKNFSVSNKFQADPTRKNDDFQEIERTKTPNKILSDRDVDNVLKRTLVNF
jgi:hypothetical protein